MDDKGKKFCPVCQGKVPLEEWHTHISKCCEFCKNSTLLKLPAPGSRMKFKNYKNMLERPFLVFADLESILKRQQQQQQTREGEELNSRKVALHKPCAAAFYFVCTFDSSRNFYWEAVGDNWSRR